MLLVVGLGNPSPKYDNTRHNIGRVAVAYFLEHLESANKISAKDFKGDIYKVAIGGQAAIVSPYLGTFMNESGHAVLTLKSFFKIETKNIIVVHDEVALPFGKLRISKAGSSGGHRGVESIIAQLGSEQFVRLRIGVESRQNQTQPMTEDFVLQKFSDDEQIELVQILKEGARAIESIITSSLEQAMNQFNQGKL